VTSEMTIEEDAEYLRELGIMKRATFYGGIVLLFFDLVLNYLGSINVGEVYVLTPAVIILLMLSLYFHDSATRSPWRGRLRVDSEFRKSSLIVIGALLVTLGGGLAISSFGGGVARVTIDMGGGTAILSIGLYIVWRYRW